MHPDYSVGPIQIPPPTPPPGALLLLGFMLGILAVAPLLRRRQLVLVKLEDPRREAPAILLPDHPVWKHCLCGYPASDRQDLVDHLEDFHPSISPEARGAILEG